MAKGDIILGSGELYIVKHTAGTNIPEHNTIEVEANSIGCIKGGASLSVAPEIYEVSGDMGKCVKRFITSQEVIFKSGILTWSLENLEKLTVGGTLTQDTTNNKNILKIGTRGSIDTYLIRFVHTMDTGKKVRLTIVGTATNGFELNFKPDEETVIDAEFKAASMDSAGTQVIIEQETATTFKAAAAE